jgi:heme A synthase
MASPWLHRWAILVAVCTLLVLVTGASVVSLEGAPAAPIFSDPGHRIAGVAVSILTFALVIWLYMGERRAGSRFLGWITLALVILEGGLGERADVPWMGVAHACVAQLLLAAAAAIAVCTSQGWARGPEPVLDHGWPSLRSLAIVTPVLVVGQTVLGAAFRHKAMSVMPHIIGAMVVALVILLVCMFVNQQFPVHRSLRPAANALMAIAFTQVFLGITAFTMRLVNDKSTAPLVISTVAHVAVGGMTLAASIVLAIQIRRNVQTPAEEPATP